MRDYLKRTIDMAKEAGRIAVSLIEKSDPSLKPDNSVLTKADTAVSRYIREALRDLLVKEGHLLIDEEDPENRRYYDDERLTRAPYVWIVDPIDGTRGFSNQLPTFGVSIGILKELKPWLGVVYLPGLRELFYADERGAVFVKEAFSARQQKKRILPVDQIITSQAVFFGNSEVVRDYQWNDHFCQILLSSCAVIDLCWPAVGRGCGCFFNSHLWDFAGSWPVFQAAGLELREIRSGKVLDRVTSDVFVAEGSRQWRVKEDYLLSSERNFAVIREHMNLKERRREIVKR
jgi:fructose-1,6-bisphosphatase/inositol monophosphatase family enzyme